MSLFLILLVVDVVVVEIKLADANGSGVDECEDVADGERGGDAGGGRWWSSRERKSRFGSLKRLNQTLFLGTLWFRGMSMLANFKKLHLCSLS